MTRAVIEIRRGNPTDEEVAALVGVLAGWSRTTAASEPAGVSPWRASGLPQVGLRPGPGAWRATRS